MDRLKKLSSLAVFGLIAAFVFQAEAQRPNSREARDTVRTLNTRLVDFENRLSYQLESSSTDRRQADEVMSDLRDLKGRVLAFGRAIDSQRDNRDDVNDILDSAKGVNDFMATNRQYRSLENDWNAIRGQLDRLSQNYGVTASWRTQNDPNRDVDYSSNNNLPVSNSPLTGTFQIDRARSEKISDVLGGSRIGAAQRREIEEKLDAPEELALDVSGTEVTLASSKAVAVTLNADGRENTEQANGKTVRVRSTLRGDKLTITSLGGETDYTITFEPQDGGRTLKVTRRITTDYLRETVFAESIYTRTSTVAGLGIRRNSGDDRGYSSNDPNDTYSRNPQPNNYPGTQGPILGKPRVGQYVVPNGVSLTATIDNDIDTKISQNNDRFRMTVNAPNEYRGAVIEGYLSGVDRSGRVLGKSNVTFNFDRITLADGTAYDFSGLLQKVVDQNGKIIAVDQEGTAAGKDKTRDTVTRGGIGAGIGAIIGAIAGGGSGAALGAIIGGGAGAGSVAIQGKGDIQLGKGSTITVQSSSPIR
ncbi:MAG: hypothetical protein ACRD6X_00595 [Pyrinomonadaceae bacterium]